MGECLIQKNGTQVDTSGVTAEDADVLSGKTYLGSDEQTHTGTMANNGSPSYTLGINGSLTLPAGSYDGGAVSQSIPVFSGQSVDVGKNAVIVATSGKYASGDITIPAVENLTAENIKYGCYVGGVGPGLWQGYINDDPNKPFYLGTFSPGNGFTALKFYNTYDIGHVFIDKDHLDIYSHLKNDETGKTESIAVLFNEPIVFNRAKYLRIKYRLPLGKPYLYASIYSGKVTDYMMANGEYNANLGTELKHVNDYDNIGGIQTYYMSLSNTSAVYSEGYLYFYVRSEAASSYSINELYIYEVTYSDNVDNDE